MMRLPSTKTAVAPSLLCSVLGVLGTLDNVGFCMSDFTARQALMGTDTVLHPSRLSPWLSRLVGAEREGVRAERVGVRAARVGVRAARVGVQAHRLHEVFGVVDSSSPLLGRGGEDVVDNPTLRQDLVVRVPLFLVSVQNQSFQTASGQPRTSLAMPNSLYSR